MRIYIKRENCSEGMWMGLPADKDEIKRIYSELEEMHPSNMIPFLAGVDPDLETLSDCLGDCLVFEDGHMALFNELDGLMDVWDEGEKARFTAALRLDHPDTIETVMDVVRHLERYVLDCRIRNWEEAGRLELENRGIQIDKTIEPFLDYETIGKVYANRKGCMTPVGYVTKKQGIPGGNKEWAYPDESFKESLLSVHMIDGNWNKVLFRLPFTEQERDSPNIRKWDSYAIKDTGGYLQELPCYLPPGITLSELNRVADVLNQEVIQKGILEKEKLYAILEAGLPENIDAACEIMTGYEDYVYVSSDICHVEYMEFLHNRCLVTTSTGYVFHSTRDFSSRLSGGQTIRLYSPLTVTVFWDDRDGFTPEILSGEQLLMQKDTIDAALKKYLPSGEECLVGFLYNRLLRVKVERMVLGTEVYEGQLWGVVEVKTRSGLTEAEHKELKDDWVRQMKEGWGMSLLEYPIYMEGGEMHIGLWDSDYGTDLCIKTEEELRGISPPVQEGRMGPYMLPG